MQKFTSTILSLILTLSSFLCINTYATVNYPVLSSSEYCEFTAAKKMTVYTDAKLKTSGTSKPYKKYGAYISKNDKCYIYKITSSYAQINYPTASGRKTGYISTSALFGQNMTPDIKFTANNKVTTYTYNGGKEYGYYETGDSVYKLSSADYSVIYTAKSGNRAYKLAYVKDKSSKKTSSSSLADIASNEIGTIGINKDGSGRGDYTKYGKWIGADGTQWCASFVSWCANRAGVSTKVVPKTAICDTMESNSNSYHKWSKNTLNSIKRNDVIFFAPTNNLKDSQHVGIVAAVNTSKNKITVIEGNTGKTYGPDIVAEITYTVNPLTGKITKGYNGFSFCGYISVS